jgi:hypothetical protein
MPRSRCRSRRRSSPGPAPLRRWRPRAPRPPWSGPPRPIPTRRSRSRLGSTRPPRDPRRPVAGRPPAPSPRSDACPGGFCAFGSTQREPALFGNVARLAKQAFGPREPAPAHGVVAVGRLEFAGEPEGTRGRGSGIRVLPMARIRPLHLGDGPVGVVRPPQRTRETLMRPCRPGMPERLLERGSGGFPVSALKRRVSSHHGVGGGLDRHDRRMMTRAGSAAQALRMPACQAPIGCQTVLNSISAVIS